MYHCILCRWTFLRRFLICEAVHLPGAPSSCPWPQMMPEGLVPDEGAFGVHCLA